MIVLRVGEWLLPSAFSIAYQLLAYRRFKRGDVAGAGALFDRTIRLDPKNSLAYRNRSAVRYQLGDVSGALDDIEFWLEHNPYSSLGYVMRGYIRQLNNQQDLAIADFTKAVEYSYPMLPVAALTNRASSYIAKEDYNAALEDCNLALRYQPNASHTITLRGLVYAHMGNYAAAMDDCDRAVYMGPRDPMAYDTRGAARYYCGYYAEAIADHSRSLELDPNYMYGFNNRGGSYLKMGDIAQALVDFNAGIERHPQMPNLYNGRGQVYFALGEFAQALADFQHAYNLRPSEHAKAGLAVTQHTLGQVDEARQLWHELIADNAKYADIERVKKRLEWIAPLVEEGCRLIAGLNPQAATQTMAGVTSVVSN